MLGPLIPQVQQLLAGSRWRGIRPDPPRALIQLIDTLQMGLLVLGARSQLFLKQPGRVDLGETVIVPLHARLLWEIHSTDQGDSAFPEAGR